MAFSAGLHSRGILSCRGLRSLSVTGCRAVTIVPRPAVPPPEETHDEKNMRLCRPQSPHLTIYKFQLPANLSITHRFTGIILSGYAATFATASLLSDKPICAVIQNISHCYPNFFLVFKLGLIFPFTYHFFNGIRHLIWDTGRGLSMTGVYVTGYLMLLTAISSAGALVYYSEEKKRKELERKRKKKEEEKKSGKKGNKKKKNKT